MHSFLILLAIELINLLFSSFSFLLICPFNKPKEANWKNSEYLFLLGSKNLNNSIKNFTALFRLVKPRSPSK